MRKILIAGGVTAAAVAAAIGIASTNTLDNFDVAGHQTVGYSSATIDGAKVDAVNYNVDPADESKLASVKITFHTAVPATSVINVGFGDTTNPLAACADSTDGLVAGAVPTGGLSAVTCTVSEDITDATAFRLLVTGPQS